MISSSTSSPQPELSSLPLPKLNRCHNFTNYKIGRGEHLVLTHEPYKSFILPHWRFRTVALAQASAVTIHALFQHFYNEKDFVGMDMCRKFLQMGMTRSKRYANYEGGRKYDGDGRGGRKQRAKGKEFDGREEKERASLIFKGWWNKARAHEGYQGLKEVWIREKKEWDKGNVKKEDVDDEKCVKVEAKGKSKRKAKQSGANEEEKPTQRSKRVQREDHNQN